jgi:ribosomal protein S18 acetylase RimI-like enzyme
MGREQFEGEIVMEDLARADYPEAVEVLALGMRDSPIHVAAFGDDPETRVNSLRHLFRGIFKASKTFRPMCARADGRIVGVCGIAPPGTCRPGPLQQLRMMPAMLALGPARMRRTVEWVTTWGDHHPESAHSHLGPVAVQLDLQGRGIGSKMLAEYAARLDAADEDAYLETDKPENVRLYERFGFKTISEGPVLDVPNWFMWRDRASGRNS